ncbi:MAG: hypothetical protein ABUS79_06855 [Pseudomonadota bacterium]
MSASRGTALVGSIAAVATMAVACAPEPLNLGDSPEIVWWTDHETGDTSDWFAGGAGSTATRVSGQLDIVPSPARSGSHALRSVVTSTGSTSRSSAFAERTGILPVNAYYSAWYQVPEIATPSPYWLCFKFRSRRVASDPATDVEGWDVDFVPGEGGAMKFALYSHADKANEPPVAMPAVPVGRWFQIEAFLRAIDDDTGQLIVWVDGVKIFDVQARATMPSAFVQWQVGSIVEGITPATVSLFVDDAAISTRRLGPDYPVFWRGR